jgi:hypothetical protein
MEVIVVCLCFWVLYLHRQNAHLVNELRDTEDMLDEAEDDFEQALGYINELIEFIEEGGMQNG